MQLVAELENGNKVYGESEIPNEAINQKSRIKKLMLAEDGAEAIMDAINAIREADAIVMGPGSLYTSIISNLLVKKISPAVRRSSAFKIYISNIMTQPGETDGFTVNDHLRELKKYGGKDIVNCVIANSGDVSKELREKYDEEGSELVKLNENEIKIAGIDIVQADLVKVDNGLIKHDSEKLAEVIVDTIMEKKLLYDKKKIIEYMYLSQRIKQREKNEKKLQNDK
jgi:uncharacterized cofD-like protein